MKFQPKIKAFAVTSLLLLSVGCASVAPQVGPEPEQIIFRGLTDYGFLFNIDNTPWMCRPAGEADGEVFMNCQSVENDWIQCVARPEPDYLVNCQAIKQPTDAGI